MKQTSPARALRPASPLIASLISYILLITPLAPLAYGGSRTRSQIKTETATTESSRAAERSGAAETQAEPSAAAAAAAVVAFAPGITATKTDAFPDPNGDGKAAPGETITYTVTITNSGPDPATGVQFNDTPDPNTTLVPGSITTQPIAQNDTASAFGNVRIATTQGAPNLLANDCDPDPAGGTCTNSGLTASGPTTSANNGNVTVSANGEFTYNPFPGFTGTDSFTYTVTDGTGKTDTATMTITVGPTLIWFIDNSQASNGDGRITSPFNSIANFNAGAADDAGDIIFLYTGTGTYTGGFTLLNNQKLIGQGFALQTETGAPPAGSNPLPGAGAAPTIDNPGSNIITLGQNNTLRGFNTGNSGAAGTDISGTGFGTLTISALSVNGDGRALNLTTGTLAATVANISASNTGSNAGLVLNAVGGALTVSGSTTITNPGGTGLDMTNSPAGTNHNFGQTTVNKDSTAGIGVNLSTNLGTTTFTTLTVTTQNNFALLANNAGTVNAAGGSLTQSGAGGAAASLINTQLNLTFTSVSSNGGVNGILISGGDGTFTTGTTNLQNNGGVGLAMSNSQVAASFGNTTVNSSAQDAVDLLTNGDNITFADLDMTPDASFRGLDATGNTGTITVTSGDITTSGGANANAVFIDGPAGRTPINITFTSVTTTSTAEAVRLVDVSGTKFQVTGTTQMNTRVSGSGAWAGVFVDNSTATNIQFATVNIPNPSAAGGDGIHVEDSTSAVTVATTTISDANVTVAQADGDNNGLPDNDGDGNAIFMRGNTGSFTLNGGTLSNCGNDCIDVRTSQNMALTGVTINGPGVDANGALSSGTGGHGIQAINLTGTNTITNSTITNWETQARDGLRYWNTTGTSTLTLHGTTFSNSENGSNAILYNGDGTSTMTLNVGGTSAGQPCTFSQVFGAAITHNAGFNAGSTSRADLNVRNNTFSGTPNGGQNSVSSRNGAGGKSISVISGNTFDNVGRTLADTSGVIDLGGDAADAGNFIHFTVTNNIIRNIGTTTACLSPASALECHGKRGIDVFIDDNSVIGNDANAAIDADDAIVIDGNVITNMQRAGIIFDVGQVFNGSNFQAKVTNNRVGIRADNTIDRVGQGDALAAGGEWAILVENRNQNAKDLNILISNNLFYNGNGGAGSALNNSGMLFRSQRTATLTGTVTNNTFNVNTSSTSFGIHVGTVNTGTPFVCFDATGNTISAPGGGFALSEVVGDLNIEQASTAALSAANGGASVTILSGAPDFGVACATPPAAPSQDEEQPEPIPTPVGGDGDGEGEPTGEAPPDGDVISSLQSDAPAAEVVNAGFSQERRADAKPLSKQFERAVAYGEGTQSAPLGATARLGFDEGDKQTRPEQKVVTKSRAVTAAAFDHNGTVHVNIGTLPAGDSVVITFQVTVNDPIPAGTTQVCNQGQVSGTNFSTVNTDDSGTGTAGDATCTPVQPPVDVTITDATASEPPTAGAQNFATFTVKLSQASGSTVTVSYATASGGANPATGGADCATAGTDYETTSGTLTFNPGQTVQTISVEVCHDGATETDETFLVNLTGATNANVTQPPADNQAVGTITDANPAGEVLISEIRTSGPGGTADDFVELYNNSDSQLTVAASDATGGWSIVKSGATCDATPVVVGTIPNGTVIPARGHYLLVGSAYSLASYPAGNGTTATGNATLTADIENDRNVGLFKTTDVGNLTTATKVDAVGFGTNTGNNCDLLRESNTLANASGSTSEYSFVRKMPLATGKPQDTNVSAADFFVVSTTPATPVGDNAAPSLGAPGPENLSSPIQRTALLHSNLVDTGSCGSCSPNRVRDTTPGPAATSSLGTLSIRRNFTNNTGAPVTRLRYRIVDMTTFPSPTGFADLRAITSSDITVTKADSTQITVTGTTLETPPAQPNGGGLNSTLASGSITTATPLAAGASINVQFLLGVQQSGSFRFYVIIEALP